MKSNVLLAPIRACPRQVTATQNRSCCNGICCSVRDAMVHIAEHAQCLQPFPSLICCSASKARLSLSLSRRLDRKAHDSFVPRQQTQTRRCTARSRSQRHIVASAYVDLQTTFEPLITRDLTATVLAIVGAYVWVRLFDGLATKGVLEQV